MKLEELKPGLLIEHAGEVHKVSTLYKRSFTAQVVFPIPERTVVRTYLNDSIDEFSPVSSKAYRAYCRASGFKP